MVWVAVTPRCLRAPPRGQDRATPTSRQPLDRATLPDARRWRAQGLLSSRPLPVGRRMNRALAAASERPVDVKKTAEPPPDLPEEEAEQTSGEEAKEELRQLLAAYIDATQFSTQKKMNEILDEAANKAIEKGIDLFTLADLIDEVDATKAFPVPMKDYLTYPTWKQTFMGVERIRKCARFLIAVGIEPKDVDTVMEGAALAASAAVAAQVEEETGSWGSMERNRDSEIMRGMGVIEMELFMDPAVQWLESRGFEDGAIAMLIEKCPAIVGSGVPYLQDGFNYLLHELLIPHDVICRMYLNQPWLLCIGRDMRMEPMVRFLMEEVGVEPEALPNTFDKCPSLLLRQVGEIACKVEFLVHVAGIQREDIAGLVISLPWLFEVDYCHEMLPKMDFLVQMMGKRESEVAAYPNFLGHHFPSQILPRHAFLVEKLGATGAAQVDLAAMLDCDDEEFAERCAGASRIEYISFRADPKTLRLCGTLLRWFDTIGEQHVGEMVARAEADVLEGKAPPPKPKEEPVPNSAWPDGVHPPDELRHMDWEEARWADKGPIDEVHSLPHVEDVPWLAPSMNAKGGAEGGNEDGGAGEGRGGAAKEGAKAAAAEGGGDGGQPEHN